MNTSLPIAAILPEIVDALNVQTNLVIQAPPGAGKTTAVPLALLDAAWAKSQRIIMLEPRRLAARAAAARMADLLGEQAGETVGYRVRLDKKIGARTRIEVVTEGILTRMLQEDPALDGVAVVIFDEFHERHLHSDLGLALCLDVQANLRENLRLIVMSATLDAQPVAALLHDAPIITSVGKSYAVDIRYCDPGAPNMLDSATANTIRTALREAAGDILVFLPGVREIQRVESLVRNFPETAALHIACLYGDLNKQQQDQAIVPSRDGKRKVVLATNIAESSLTIEGVTVVIDSGLMRKLEFDPNSAMSRLATTRISQASATQRAGRAGRLGPGVCYRLWSQEAQQRLLPFNIPEIQDQDLAPLVLELAQWGVQDANRLRWINVPPAANLAQARDLLVQLQALNDHGQITAHGRDMHRLGYHPRLAHMMLRGKELGVGYLACEVAALLNERDIIRGKTVQKDSDIGTRLSLWRSIIGARGGVATSDQNVDKALCFQLKEQAELWARQLGVVRRQDDLSHVGKLAALAYPDRVAQRRGGSDARYLLANGRGAGFAVAESLSSEKLIVIAQLDAGQREARIFLAASLDEDTVFSVFGDLITRHDLVEWNDRTQSVQARRVWRYGAITLREQQLLDIPQELRTHALFQGIINKGIGSLPWTDRLREWQARVLLLQRINYALPEEPAAWPEVSDGALVLQIQQWLGPYLNDKKQLSDINEQCLTQALASLLTWRQQQALDVLTPTHLTVASGSHVRLDYRTQDKPVLAVRLQELFGERTTPSVANGRVPVILHLLSPGMRIAQITEDLAGFWANSYADVKKDLKARYPKHLWPDDPLNALPTARARPRKP
ncbi:MAG: ATP-dependent helicase HrpB [Pseudomonadota bacterium]